MTADDPRGNERAFHLQNLSVTFSTPAGVVPAVRNLSLTVGPGECLGVVGESGAGKSQAFLAALGLLSSNGRASGSARLGTRELLGLRQRELDEVRGARIGLVFQDPMTALTPHLRIGAQIAEPLRKHLGLSAREAADRARALLSRVHITDTARRMGQYPHELSGGMRQRVMVAIAIACDPVLLIADEPTTSLDATLQAQILSLLTELKRSRGMALVLITHDMGAVAGVADRVAVMRAGEVVEIDTARSVFRSPKHEYTRVLLDAVPRLDAAVTVRRGASTVGGSAASASAASASEAGASAAGASAVGPSTGELSTGGDVPLAVSDVHVDFPLRAGWFSGHDVLHAVQGVSLQLTAGEAVGVVGESGSGKTTLARAALRLLSIGSGRIVWLGRSVEQLSERELRPLRRDVQVIFQDPLASLDPRMTVAEIIAEPLQTQRSGLSPANPRAAWDPAARRAAIAHALARVHLDPALATRYPHELSGGQCQRVAIARAIVLQPRVLICDEAVSALDVTIQQQIVTLLADLKREAGLTILFISHNLAVVRQLCERILVLYAGRMMELAPAAAIYSDPRHPYTQELLDSAPVPDPDVQPGRLGKVALGEPASPAPGGCAYRLRCPHALAVCHGRVPEWEAAADAGRRVACHRWRDLASHPEVSG